MGDASSAADELTLVSASQIDTFRDCPRKWAWDKLEGVERASNAAAERGTYVHARLEEYMKTGVLDVADHYGAIAASGLKHLPKPGSVKGVEEYFDLIVGPIHYRGYMDLHWVQHGAIPVNESFSKSGEISQVLDHKTTSDFKWMKTEEDLKKDVQANIYATAAFFIDGTEAVDLTWVYYLDSKKPRSKKTHLRVLREDVEPVFEGIHATALQMREVRQNYPGIMELPFNVRACQKYGGCHYVNHCNLSARDMAQGIYMQQSLADKMKAKLQNKNGAPPKEEQPTSPETPAAKGNDAGSLAAKMKARMASKPQVNPPPAEESPVVEAKPEAHQEEAEQIATETSKAAPAERTGGDDMRDATARAAMEALIARREHSLSDPETPNTIAALAYEFSDAMVKAR